jgi:hypothetical protein
MWKWIKIPKGIALLAFFLPWMTVSCSGQQLATGTGFQLLLGKLEQVGDTPPQNSGELNLWLALAVAMILIGLGVSFAKFTRQLALIPLITSALALLGVWLGTSKYSKSALLAEASKSRGDRDIGHTADSMIQIDWHFGFWLTLAMLVVAAAMAWLAYSGKDADLLGSPGKPSPPA